ncbi:MAG: PilZ domain-containing protein [Planctomycetota bacterium]|jgi:c-di-GMP-binding flagellar brake protein YcgR
MKTKRRVYPRIGVNITITHLGNAINISEGGMCVIIDNTLPVGHKVDLDLVLPNPSNDDKQKPSNPIKLEGTIAWTKYSELLGKHEVGIKFTDVHVYSKEILKSFIEKYT